MNNEEIIKILINIADILTLQNDKFRPRAYLNAARSIELLDEPLKDIAKRNELQNIPNVGEHIAKKIEELLKTNKLKYYNKLKKQTKINVEELNRIPSLGPKRMKILYEKLNIRNIKDLEKAIKKHKIQTLPGFTEKSEKNLQENINLAKLKVKRFPYKDIKPIANKLKKQLLNLKEVKTIKIAGSFRREEATIGDLDLLIISKSPKPIMEFFTKMNDVKRVLAKGTTKASILLNNNLQVDLRIVKKDQYGAALLYFTGNKAHNIHLRQIAKKLGLTLNEYGLYNIKTKKLITSKTEKEIYKKLGLKYLTPKERKK
ncbi:hypothetical protein HOI26_03895 [Candidatus Woesearchaeota archaeon]|nr:hypothetical protein [Candidatus Woesearchaeota archaeon]MBT5740218.1 hypothetical protein [Candidatus Woesearchaeota archaeon]